MYWFHSIKCPQTHVPPTHPAPSPSPGHKYSAYQPLHTFNMSYLWHSMYQLHTIKRPKIHVPTNSFFPLPFPRVKIFILPALYTLNTCMSRLGRAAWVALKPTSPPTHPSPSPLWGTNIQLTSHCTHSICPVCDAACISCISSSAPKSMSPPTHSSPSPSPE